MTAVSVVLIIILMGLAPLQLEAKPISPDFVELSKKLKPTVVNIRTIKQIKPRTGGRTPSPFMGNDPFNNLFE